jgi:hypothetical protein
MLEHVLEKIQFSVARAIALGFARVNPQLREGTFLHGRGLCSVPSSF